MAAEIRPDYPTEWAAMKAVAAKLGIGAAETVRTWVRKAEVDAGRRPDVKADAALRISFARRNSAFSAFRRLISAVSSEVSHGL